MKIALFDPGLQDNLGAPSSNLGDLIIQEAVDRELKRVFPEGDIFRISTHVKIPSDYFPLLAECRHVIVGGTNLLTSFMDEYKQWKIDSRDARRIRRAVLLGVGWWQYQEHPDLQTWFTLLCALSWRGVQSVRDEYSRKRLASLGLVNATNTGCPTMWPFLEFDQSLVPTAKAENALLMLTDYSPHPEADTRLIKLMLAHYREVYFWPQGRHDLEYMDRLNLPVRRLEHTIESLREFFRTGPPVDYIGTRLHGGVYSLLHEKRSLILEVDNRAREIAQDTGLPTAPREDTDAVQRWIQGSARLNIRMNRSAIEKWRAQFHVSGSASEKKTIHAEKYDRQPA